MHFIIDFEFTLVNFLNVLDFLLFDTYYALFINLFLQYFGSQWSTGLGPRAEDRGK